MARFWVYIGDKIQGPVDIPSLRKVPGFTLLTQVCLEGEQSWRMADEVIEIKSYFLAPPRVSSLIAEGNAVAVTEPVPQEAPPLISVIEPAATIETLEEPAAAPTPVVLKAPGESSKEAPAAAGLRVFCSVCGYKNPR